MKNFIICLSKIEASLKTATDLKIKLEEYNEDVELFEGTYGNDAVNLMIAEKRNLHPVSFKGPIDIDDEEEKSIIKMKSPGVKGCFYSHYKLWKKCVELDESIIIWEDDIILVRPFQPVEWEEILIVALGHPSKSEKYINYLKSPTGRPQAEEYFQASMPGCCGYAITPNAAKKLIDTYDKTYLPADNAINQHLVKIQIHNYIMGRALVKTDGKKSLTKAKFWNTYNKD